VDANSAYTLDDAAHLKKLDEFNLLMMEQPLSWDDIYGHSKLQGANPDGDLPGRVHLQTRITRWAAIEMKACRIINIKLGARQRPH